MKSLINKKKFNLGISILRLNSNYIFASKTKYSNSSHVKIDLIEQCSQWILKLNKQNIPKLCYEIQYVRSSGPGGQNVNKLNTKCSLKVLNISKSGYDLTSTETKTQYKWIPSKILEQLLNGNKKTEFKQCDLMKLYYKPLQDCLVIQSDTQRSRHLNESECFLKLQKMFDQSFYVEREADKEDQEKWDIIRKREKEKRLKDKKFKKLRKELKSC
ncbi:hypothetical protein QEN19_004056 [Hanseniaspora menglaensis]